MCTVAATQGAIDLIAALGGGAVEAVEALLDRSLIEDCVDVAAGETIPLVVVTDDGPAMKSVAVTRCFAVRSHLTRVRTRHRAPHTTGVVERWIETLKYERLYRHDTADGVELADHVADFTDRYDTIRPHQALDQTPPGSPTYKSEYQETDPPETGQMTWLKTIQEGVPQLSRYVEGSKHKSRAIGWFSPALKGGGEVFVSEQQSRNSDRELQAV